MTVVAVLTVWCDAGEGTHGYRAKRSHTPAGARAEAAKEGWTQRPPLGGTTNVRDICPRHR